MASYVLGGAVLVAVVWLILRMQMPPVRQPAEAPRRLELPAERPAPVMGDRDVRHDATVDQSAAPSYVKLTACTLSACWLIFAITWLTGSAQHAAPLFLLLSALLGIQGYAGDFVAIFLYWTLFGAWLAWSTRNPRDLDALITRGFVVHGLITVVTWIPMMLLFGSR
jgi:hypothetical protein